MDIEIILLVFVVCIGLHLAVEVCRLLVICYKERTDVPSVLPFSNSPTVVRRQLFRNG